MKVYQILLIIILVLVIILGIRVYNSNKQPEYSQEEVKAILDKAQNIRNYKYISKNNHGTELNKYIRKENEVYFQTLINDNIVYINADEMAHYAISNSEKVVVKTKVITNNVPTSNNVTNNMVPKGNSLYTNSEYNANILSKYEFDKAESCMGKECIRLKGKETLDENIWFDIDTGLIMKIASKDEKYQVTYSYEFNTVTDDDFKLPDFSDYKVIEK